MRPVPGRRSKSRRRSATPIPRSRNRRACTRPSTLTRTDGDRPPATPLPPSGTATRGSSSGRGRRSIRASKSSEHADEATALRDEYGIDVVDAVEIDADNATSASGAVGNYRSDRTVVCVVGGDDGLNRFAVEEPRVDVLVRPMGGGDFNHVLAKAARDNGVHVEFDRPAVPRDRRKASPRAGGPPEAPRDRDLLRHAARGQCEPAVAPRPPRAREVVAAAEAVGFDAEWVREGLRAWGEIATRNRERRPRRPS